MKKRIVSVIVLLTLLLSLAIPALAEEVTYVAVVDGVGYASVQEAVDAANGNLVTLQADSQETVSVQGDLYLDLNGHSLSKVTVSGTLYGMDSATDGYEGAYGKITAVNGNYASVITVTTAGGMRRYVAIAEETGISFHRYYAAVTAVSLKPNSDALGYKAVFRGDEAVRAAVESFGFNMWVSKGNIKAYTRNGGFTDGQVLTLRLQNILAAGGGDLEIHAQAIVKFSHVADPAVGSQQTTTMKDVLQSVNAAWDNYSEEQKQAVQALCGKFDVTKAWELNNILPSA